jgi:hypothetical protein
MVDADEVNVGTKALARVEHLIAEEGQRVQPGTLATLSSPEITGGQRRRKVRSMQHARLRRKRTRARGRKTSQPCARHGRQPRRQRIWRRSRAAAQPIFTRKGWWRPSAG